MRRTLDAKVLLRALFLTLVGGGLVIGILLLCGCSGLQAKPAMAARIDNNAVCAKIALATVQSIGEAKTSLHVNSVALDEYYRAATINLFAYWFSDKQIYCTPKYYKLLQKTAISSAAWDFNAAANKYLDTTIYILLGEEYRWFILYADALHGRAE